MSKRNTKMNKPGRVDYTFKTLTQARSETMRWNNQSLKVKIQTFVSSIDAPLTSSMRVPIY